MPYRRRKGTRGRRERVLAAAAARIWGSRRMTVVTRIRPPWAPSWTAAVRAAGIEVLARDTPGPRASIENFFAYDESGFRTTIPAREWFSRAGLPLPPVDVAVFKEEVSDSITKQNTSSSRHRLLKCPPRLGPAPPSS